jgi:ribose 5-phosphate isomerase B
MRITIGSDHAGFDLKQVLAEHLRQNGYQVNDAGTNNTAPVDYPDFAEAVALSVLRGECERGILICGSGVGAAVAANKIPGIRAGQCHDTYSAHQGVEHDDMNVLVLGARVIGVELAKELCTRFLQARFTAEERHQRRLAKTLSIEQRYAATAAARKKEP